jgi:hypothetical protein
MSDEVDQASDKQLELERRTLDRIRAAAAAPLPTSELCLWCGERTVNNARWCGPACRDDWQAHGGGV